MGWVQFASQMASVNGVAVETSLRLTLLSKWQWAEVNGWLSKLSQLAIREAASPRPTAAILLFSPPSPAPASIQGRHDPPRPTHQLSRKGIQYYTTHDSVHCTQLHVQIETSPEAKPGSRKRGKIFIIFV